MEIYEMREALQCAQRTARELEESLDSVEDACEQWEALSGEGYSDSSEVIDKIAEGENWIQLGEETRLDPDEVAEALEGLDDIREGIEQLRMATDITLEGSDSAEQIIDALRGQSNKGVDEVMAAIQMLIGALHRAGALGGTEAVPTIVTMEPPHPVVGSDDTADSGMDKE